MADYIPVFLDWTEATQELNSQEKGRLIDAMVMYARGGDWQEQIKGNERYVFPMFRGQIDRHMNKVEALRENGKRGGSKPKQTEANSSKRKQSQANNNNNNNNNENNNDNKNENENHNGVTERARARFTPPTVDEVSTFCLEHGYSVDAEKFVAYYDSNGWKVGRNPMKDWKAAVRTWARNDYGGGGAKPSRPGDNAGHMNFKQRQYEDGELDYVFTDLSKYMDGKGGG